MLLERFRTTRRLQQLLLAWSFSVLAAVNLLLSALPIVTLGARPTGAPTWAAATLRVVAAGTICAAAWVGSRSGPRKPVIAPLLAGTLAVLVLIGLMAAAADAWLANPVDPSLPPASSGWPRIEGHPVVLGIQLVALGLYTIAAIGFSRQARGEADELLRWVGAGAMLSAFARLNYFFFPSLYSNWVSTGDLLRLAAYLFFVVGAAREIDAYWRNHSRMAANEERRRLARELHDGLTQELAFIRSQTSAMAAGLQIPGTVEHVAAAAGRALQESRRAIEILSGDERRSLPEVLRTAGEEVAGRAGATVQVEADALSDVAGSVAEALVRVVRESVTNAVRHGGAKSIDVRLACREGTLEMEVTDDGRGFDPQCVRHGFGLTSMRERVEGLGGTLSLTSEPGRGTTLRAQLPV
ncbi:MAG: sensor histidine kinase [Actinomycetota bacterium]|nr:sensor histidine kinase [Actinomycetota bacterium]